jgi:hypothetical protein
MTKPITDTIRKSYEASAELFRSGRWAFGLAWRSHRFSLMGRILCAVLTGLVPAAFAMVIRGVVNAVVLAAKQPEHDMSTILPWLLGALALSHLAARLTRGQRRCWLRIQRSWPWATQVTAAFARLSTLPVPTG